MKLVYFIVCLTAVAFGVFGEQPKAEITFRKLISGTSTVTFSYEAADHLLELQASELAGEDEIGIRYAAAGSPGISFGRAIYAGPMRMFIDPARVFLPSDLMRRSLWSLRMSQLKQQRFAAGASGEFRDSQWDLLFDHQRSAVAGVLRITAGKAGFGCAAVCQWTADAPEQEEWTYCSRRITETLVSASAWAAWEGEYVHAGASGGISTAPHRLPGSWFNTGCSWQLGCFQGRGGIYWSSRGVRTVNGGEVSAAWGASIAGELSLPSGVTLTGGYRRNITEVPGQTDEGAVEVDGGIEMVLDAAAVTLTAEYRISGNAKDFQEDFTISLETEAHHQTLPWKAEAAWNSGDGFCFAFSGEYQYDMVTVTGNIETTLADRRMSLSSIRLTAEVSSGVISSSIRYLTGRGMSLGFSGSIPICHR